MSRADNTSFSYGKPQFLLMPSEIDWYTMPPPIPNSEISGRKNICQNRLLVFLLVPPDHDDIS